MELIQFQRTNDMQSFHRLHTSKNKDGDFNNRWSSKKESILRSILLKNRRKTTPLHKTASEYEVKLLTQNRGKKQDGKTKKI